MIYLPLIMGSLGLKDFLSLADLDTKQIQGLLSRAFDLKTAKKADCPLIGKSLVLIFRKPSMRTRLSFEVGMYQLGGQAIGLSMQGIGLGEREPVKDAARVFARYAHGIVLRTYAHTEVLELAQYADIPVINGLDDLEHPCQALADIFTIQEKKGTLKGLKLVYVGDGNNVCHSLMQGASKVGMEMVVASPRGYQPKKEIVKKIQGSRVKGQVSVVEDPREAVAGADIIYTDVWTSMGREKEAIKRKKIFKDYQLNSKLVSLAKKDALIMHCLPAHRGEEITDEVFESKNSVIFDQAENRLHAQKAILVELLGG